MYKTIGLLFYMGIVRHVFFFDAVNYWHFGFGFKVFREKIMVQNRQQIFQAPFALGIKAFYSHQGIPVHLLIKSTIRV